MSEWHDSSCRRLDVFTSGGISSCLSCGSIQPEPDISSHNDSNNHGDIYQTLENNTDMRLLTLEPGGYDDPVCGSLHLTTTSGFLEYDAISYTWAGEDENMERSGHIMLNFQRFSVTPNCEAALRRARSRSGPKAIWIDAICINQEDLRERGHQVRLMQQIYSRADSVLIYLGEPSREEDELLAFVSGQDELLSRDPDLLRRLRRALCRLFQRRYFSRVWVLQEVALARRAMLVCGNHWVPWSSMGIQRLDRIGLLEYSQGPGSYPTLTGLDRLPAVLNFRAPAYRDPSELLELLEATRGSRATDPRDKVFALLGLLTCPESEGLSADYTKSTAEIYTSIAIWIAQRFGLPELLSRTCVLRGKPHVGYQTAQWVPYWASDDFQTLKSGLEPQETVDSDPEPTRTRADRLPVTVCERDNTAIKFPAFLLGTSSQVLRHRNQNGGSVFDSVPRSDNHSIIGAAKDYVSVISTLDPVPDEPIGNRFLEMSHYIHLNYAIHKEEKESSQIYEENPLHSSVSAKDPLDIHTWTRDLVYLIPEPVEDGSQFTKPGFASMSNNRSWGPKEWTHTDDQGKVTKGLFSDYAVCCAEYREGDDTRIYLRGLLEHRGIPCPRLQPKKFEFVSAR